MGLQSEVRWCTSGRPAQPAELIGDATLPPPARSAAAARSWTLQEPEIERHKYQDNTDVHQQPSPELVPEEQDVHADHDGYHREHVKHDGCPASHGYPPSHRFILVRTMPGSPGGGPAGPRAMVGLFLGRLFPGCLTYCASSVAPAVAERMRSGGIL